ncbi:MAG: DUF5685 family protein [Eubacteriales bacterium]
MFGYIVPDKPELKIREFDRFKSYYCGLCKTLKTEYTFFSRLFLNYDCSFLSLVMDSLNEQAPACTQEACVVSPFKKKCIAHGSDAKYAAAINVLLAKNSLADHIRDEKKIYLLPAVWMLARGYRRAKRDYPKAAETIESALNKLKTLEAEKEANLDKVADVFAVMLSELVSAGVKTDKRAFKHLGYHVGRWLYLIDAADDLEKDIKKGCYNPLVYRYGYQTSEDIQDFKKRIYEEVEFNLFYSLSEAAAAYDLIDFKKNKEILTNIIYSGIKKRTQQVLMNVEREA